uniref:Uncharacterized protein n=1 Tax=Knipowitschia caucasica TaxID=637954 RepID=A0AAV2KQZ3_KNICA
MLTTIPPPSARHTTNLLESEPSTATGQRRHRHGTKKTPYTPRDKEKRPSTATGQREETVHRHGTKKRPSTATRQREDTVHATGQRRHRTRHGTKRRDRPPPWDKEETLSTATGQRRDHPPPRDKEKTPSAATGQRKDIFHRYGTKKRHRKGQEVQEQVLMVTFLSIISEAVILWSIYMEWTLTKQDD